MVLIEETGMLLKNRKVGDCQSFSTLTKNISEHAFHIFGTAWVLCDALSEEYSHWHVCDQNNGQISLGI